MRIQIVTNQDICKIVIDPDNVVRDLNSQLFPVVIMADAFFKSPVEKPLIAEEAVVAMEARLRFAQCLSVKRMVASMMRIALGQKFAMAMMGCAST